jgi:hypothetical protein
MEAEVSEQIGAALGERAPRGLIFADYDAHGRSATTRVPPPGGSHQEAAVERLEPVGDVA